MVFVLFEIFVVFFAGDMNDKGSRADRYHIAVVEQCPLAVAQQFVAEECAGEAGVVSHGEYGAPAFFLDRSREYSADDFHLLFPE